MASTMAAMSNAIRASEVATLTTNMNQGLRTAMDIMVRDMLQVGQGLPSGRTIDIPNGTGATAVRLPGAPATTPVTSSPVIRAMPATASEITAIVPGAGIGPTINGTATDVITMVLADGAFLSTISDYDVNLTGLTATSMMVDPAVDISNGGADDLHVGDLIMIQKGTSTALVQITGAPLPSTTGTAGQTVTFAAGDSLNLNQTAAAYGTLTKHIAIDVKDIAANVNAAGFYPSTATRIRMISYYIDAVTDPARPRLVRRINNGSCSNCSTVYNNLAGTAVAFDVENLQIYLRPGGRRQQPFGGQDERGRPGGHGRRRLPAQPVLAEPDPQDQRDHHRPLPHHDAADAPVFPEHADDPGQPAQHVVHGSLQVIIYT